MKRLTRMMMAVALSWPAATAFADEAIPVQELVLRAKPAVALVTARVDAEVTVNCGAGPITVKPLPFQETGTGWFVDGRGYLITNAHVVDPAHRLPPWVTHELKKNAVDQACVDPMLARQGLMRGQRPDVEDQIRRRVDMASIKLKPLPQVTVLLSNGTVLPTEIKKFSPPLLLDASGKPVPDSGRDLALLRIKDGVYPALALAEEDTKIGEPVRIIGFPGVVLSHELLNKTAALEASVTTGAVSGLKQDAIGQDVIQTDAPAAPGNSGGPAVGHSGAVVGVLTFVSLSPTGGNIVQGFNFLIPGRDIKKFLQGTEVTKPGDSRFNPIWAAGLRDLSTDSFKSAAAKFAETNKLLPDLPDVKRALAEAEFKVKNPPPRPFPWAWVTLGLALVSGSGYGAMWLRRWQRNRFRIKAGQVVKMIEEGVNPLLLDVRKESAAKTAPLKIPGATYISPDGLEKGQAGIEVDPNRTVVAYCT
ncbi:MAG: trypsin-like peptidase domain-containing protein [Candidatus Rokubacteria bacterium]|nr:trypsin-like peptidase domain-containing protein [Candidatus Rokubacteria bacterium]